VAVVEAGVILSDLFRDVEAHGLCYPIYPGEESATVGGNVATNAGGMMAVKYGVTRNFVLELEAVLPTGEIIRTGGKYGKVSMGYD
jgi:glycolate oxidase